MMDHPFEGVIPEDELAELFAGAGVHLPGPGEMIGNPEDDDFMWDQFDPVFEPPSPGGGGWDGLKRSGDRAPWVVYGLMSIAWLFL